jgi:membrane-associated phospholipid phosphatase
MPYCRVQAIPFSEFVRGGDNGAMEPATTNDTPKERVERTLAFPKQIWLFGIGAVLTGAACLLGFWVLIRANHQFPIDEWWNQLLAQWVSPFMLTLSQTMNFLGGGWFGAIVVPLGGALTLILLRRPWSAAYFITAEAASAGAVQLLKHLFGRARPEDIIVITDYGSYPSGHVANATTMAVSAVFLFPRLWVMFAGIAWFLLMALSRTYLHAHWLSDTIGGMLIGAGVAFLVAGVFAKVIAKERWDAVTDPDANAVELPG